MTLKNLEIKALLLSAVSGFLFTVIIYNAGIKVFIIKYAAITFFYGLLYTFLKKKFQLTNLRAAIYSIITPLIIDASVFMTNSNLVPLRFPFASTFLLLGVLLGYVFKKNKSWMIGIPILAIVYFILSHWLFIPAIIFSIETRQRKISLKGNFSDDRFLSQLGDTVRLKNNEIIFLDFFFIGCQPCEFKRKMFEEIDKELKGEKFSIFLICDGRISSYKDFVKYCSSLTKYQQIFLLYDYDGNMEKRLGDIKSFPYEIVLKNNSIIKEYSGFDKEPYELNKKERIEIIKKFTDE